MLATQPQAFHQEYGQVARHDHVLLHLSPSQSAAPADSERLLLLVQLAHGPSGIAHQAVRLIRGVFHTFCCTFTVRRIDLSLLLALLSKAPRLHLEKAQALCQTGQCRQGLQHARLHRGQFGAEGVRVQPLGADEVP